MPGVRTGSAQEAEGESTRRSAELGMGNRLKSVAFESRCDRDEREWEGKGVGGHGSADRGFGLGGGICI